MIGVLDRQLQEDRFNGNFYKQRIEQLSTEPPELGRPGAPAEHGGSRPERGRRTGWPSSRRPAQEGPALRGGAALAGEAAGRSGAARLGAGARELRPQTATRRCAASCSASSTRWRCRRTGCAVLAERAGSWCVEAETAEQELSERESEVRATLGAARGTGLSQEASAAASRTGTRLPSGRTGGEMALARVRAEGARPREAARSVVRRRAERRPAGGGGPAGPRASCPSTTSWTAPSPISANELNATLRPDLSDSASRAFSGT